MTGYERGRFRLHGGYCAGTFGLTASLTRNSVFWAAEFRLGPLFMLILLMHRSRINGQH